MYSQPVQLGQTGDTVLRSADTSNGLAALFASSRPERVSLRWSGHLHPAALMLLFEHARLVVGKTSNIVGLASSGEGDASRLEVRRTSELLEQLRMPQVQYLRVETSADKPDAPQSGITVWANYDPVLPSGEEVSQVATGIEFPLGAEAKLHDAIVMAFLATKPAPGVSDREGTSSVQARHMEELLADVISYAAMLFPNTKN